MLYDYLSCIFGTMKIIIYKMIYFRRLSFKSIPYINNHFKIAIKKGARLVIGKKLRTRENVTFRVYNNGLIDIGDGCFFNENCIFNCQDKIIIGNNVIFGPNIQIIDNDHDYKNDNKKYVTKPVIIGNNVWIGANAIILKGVTIGDNCVIAAGTIVKKSISANKIAYNKLTSVESDINYEKKI